MNLLKRITERIQAAFGPREQEAGLPPPWGCGGAHRPAAPALPPSLLRVEDVLDDGDKARAERRRARLAEAMERDSAAPYRGRSRP